MVDTPQHGRRWRFYRTASGRRPVREFLDGETKPDASEILSAMDEIAEKGTRLARHLRGDIWEVRVDGLNCAYRVLFSQEGRFQHVLLALEAFAKKTQKTPSRTIELAEKRLADWRQRGKAK